MPFNLEYFKKSPTGPSERTPKPEYLVSRSQLTYQVPLGFWWKYTWCGYVWFILDGSTEVKRGRCSWSPVGRVKLVRFMRSLHHSNGLSARISLSRWCHSIPTMCWQWKRNHETKLCFVVQGHWYAYSWRGTAKLGRVWFWECLYDPFYAAYRSSRSLRYEHIPWYTPATQKRTKGNVLGLLFLWWNLTLCYRGLWNETVFLRTFFSRALHRISLESNLIIPMVTWKVFPRKRIAHFIWQCVVVS